MYGDHERRRMKLLPDCLGGIIRFTTDVTCVVKNSRFDGLSSSGKGVCSNCCCSRCVNGRTWGGRCWGISMSVCTRTLFGIAIMFLNGNRIETLPSPALEYPTSVSSYSTCRQNCVRSHAHALAGSSSAVPQHAMYSGRSPTSPCTPFYGTRM